MTAALSASGSSPPLGGRAPLISTRLGEVASPLSLPKKATRSAVSSEMGTGASNPMSALIARGSFRCPYLPNSGKIMEADVHRLGQNLDFVEHSVQTPLQPTIAALSLMQHCEVIVLAVGPFHLGSPSRAGRLFSKKKRFQQA